MKSETFSGTMENAYGKVLPSKVNFSGSFDAYENIGEIKAANDLPSDDEVVSFTNSKRKASARQKAMNAALEAAGIQKPTLEDPQVQLATLIKVLVASGRTEEQATQLAKTTLGVE